MKVRVKVDEAGYFDLRFRKEGEVFDIPSEQQFSERWMEKVDPPAPPVEPKPEPKVQPKVEPKAGKSKKSEGSSGKPKPATGDQKVL